MRTILEETELRNLYGEFHEIERLESSRKRKDGLHYYVPNAMQMKAHKSLAKIILFCGGNRTGKSTFGAVELAMHITRNYPSWYPYERRFDRPIKAVVVATANSIIEKVIEPKLWAYMPMSAVDSIKRVTGGYLFRIAFKNGSLIDFLSSESDDMSFESADYDFYWGDEPQKRKKFQAIMRGLIDRGGQTVLTFTPLVEPWMKEDLVDKSDGKRIECFIVDMLDNRFDIEGNPILSQENIDFFTSTWDDDTKETRMHGRFFHLRGQVYPMFSEVHQIHFDYVYPDPVISVLDPHDRQPHHVIWAVIDRNDDILVHNELSIACTVDELAKRIKNIEKANGYKMRRRLIDPNFGRKPLITTGRNLIQELSYSGCPGWFEADDPKDEGRLKVKDYLSYNMKIPISHTNRPKLYFHKQNCPLTIHSIRNHQYEEWVGKTGEDRDPKEKSKDKDTHGADCFDEKTEVLTSFGWKLFKNISIGELLMTSHGQYEPCSDVISYKYCGKMIQINSQHIDILCTPNHRLLVDKGRDGKLEFCEASDVKKTYRIPRIPSVYDSMLNGSVSIKPTWTSHGNKWEKQHHIPSKVWAEFIGWYVSEGSCTGTKGGKVQIPGRGYQVIISQSDVNSEKVKIIRNVLSKLPWSFKRIGNNFICSSKQLWEVLRPLGNSFQKRIPRDVLNLSMECLEKLWDSMVLGDGWFRSPKENRQGREHYASISNGLSDDVQELLLKIGKPSSVQVREAKSYCIKSKCGTNTKDQNIINAHRQTFGVLRDSSGNSKIKIVDYSGMVYCATVPSHTLVTRRNQKTSVVGNCVRYLCMSNPLFNRIRAMDYELAESPY